MRGEAVITSANVSGRVREGTPVEALLREGNEAAWEWCFNRWFPSLYAYAHRMTGDATAAGDVAAEAFAAACRDIDRYESRGVPFESFLYRLTHDRAVDFLRHRARHATVRLDAAGPMPVNDDTGRHAERVALLAAIEALTEEQRAVVLLRFFAGFDAEETGNIMGRSPGAVRGLQFRALASLRRLLSDEQGAEKPAGI